MLSPSGVPSSEEPTAAESVTSKGHELFKRSRVCIDPWAGIVAANDILGRNARSVERMNERSEMNECILYK